MHPHLVEANRYINSPFGIASVIKVKKECTLGLKSESFRDDFFKIAIDGKHNPSGRYRLCAGKHWIGIVDMGRKGVHRGVD